MKTQKTLQLIFAALVLLFSTTDSFGSDVPVADGNKMITTIKSAISYPGFLKNAEEAKARVNFTVSEEGKINLIEVQTNDEKLKAYIEKSLRGISSEDLQGIKGTYSTNIIFRQQ